MVRASPIVFGALTGLEVFPTQNEFPNGTLLCNRLFRGLAQPRFRALLKAETCMKNNTHSSLLDIIAVKNRVGGTRPVDAATIYRMIARGELPRPIKIGPRLSRWREDEIEAALRRCDEARGAAPD